MSRVKMITVGKTPMTTSDALSETDTAVTSMSLGPYSECRQTVQDARSVLDVTSSLLTVLAAALSTAKLPITSS